MSNSPRSAASDGRFGRRAGGLPNPNLPFEDSLLFLRVPRDESGRVA